MENLKHYDFDTEKNYLKESLEVLDFEIKRLEEDVLDFEKSMKEIKKVGNKSDELQIKINLFELKAKKLKELQKSKEKAYFGRIDFKEDDNDTNTYYIGKTSLERNSDKKRYILDWRAPICGLYYSGELGTAMYTAPDGLITGELKLKRQYEIDYDNIINIFDKGLTPMDEFLQNALSKKKDNRLKDIVSTIQKEQNDIIRANKDSNLIVQGVAGSGKTTIILHRIAYLLYTYKDELKPKNILMLFPNKLFLNYIKDVLPDLGVSDIRQNTFIELAFSMMNEELNIFEEEKNLLALLYDEEQRDKIARVCDFKSSLEFKEAIDSYLKESMLTRIDMRDIKIKGYTLFKQDSIRDLYENEFSYLCINKRIKRVTSYIKKLGVERAQILIDKIEEKCILNINKIEQRYKDDLDLLKEKKINLYDKKSELVEFIDKKKKNTIHGYTKFWKKFDYKKLYKEFVSSKENLRRHLREDDYYIIDDLIEVSNKSFIEDKFDIEDISGLLYMYIMLNGIEEDFKFSHIVIDEAQDYSKFQMEILKKLNRKNSFTIVGDLSQGIHSYRGVNSWDDIIIDVFKNKRTKYLKIRKSYRCTKQIMEFANDILRNVGINEENLAEPVLREGDEVKYYNYNKKIDINDIKTKIKELKSKDFKSIAIITRSLEETRALYEELNKEFDIQILKSKDDEYKKEIVILPIHLCKGLEFDCVLLYDFNENMYKEDELFSKLFYVGITRALHKLYIYKIN
ncbi:RNA polymerase recycling motor HelD [Peptostreptococcaceae bacterium AGR-M142]